MVLDALALAFDADRWTQEFLANWPVGSPTHASYFERIAEGPDYVIERARAVIHG